MSLLLFKFKVDVRFPQNLFRKKQADATVVTDLGTKSQATNLGHVQPRLRDCDLINTAGSINIPEKRLELSKPTPGGAVVRPIIQKLFVQNPAAVELAKLQLHLDVRAEKFVFRTFSNRDPLK